MEFNPDPLFHPLAVSELDSADIEVTYSQLLNPTFMEYRLPVPSHPPNRGHLPRDWQCMYIRVLTPASSARDLGYMYHTTPSDSG